MKWIWKSRTVSSYALWIIYIPLIACHHRIFNILTFSFSGDVKGHPLSKVRNIASHGLYRKWLWSYCCSVHLSFEWFDLSIFHWISRVRPYTLQGLVLPGALNILFGLDVYMMFIKGKEVFSDQLCSYSFPKLLDILGLNLLLVSVVMFVERIIFVLSYQLTSLLCMEQNLFFSHFSRLLILQETLHHIEYKHQ